MINVYDFLEQRRQYLEMLIRDADRALETAPAGNLKVCSHAGRTQYYIRRNSSDQTGSYVRKSDIEKACALAQRDYLTNLKKSAYAELGALDALNMKLPKVRIEEVYEKLSAGRKTIVRPLILTDEMYRRTWEEMEYDQKPVPDLLTEYYTERRERVRSKSEVLIANTLFYMDIPYRYECPLKLGRQLLHPDFTVLNTRTRKEYFWEHFGMMDNANYAEQVVERMNLYQKGGIYPGEQLIITMESSRKSLSTKRIKEIAEHYLK